MTANVYTLSQLGTAVVFTSKYEVVAIKWYNVCIINSRLLLIELRIAY